MMTHSEHANRLELGAGTHQTPGFVHNDLHPFENIEHVGHVLSLEFPDNRWSMVLALGVVEHFSYEEVSKVFRRIHRWLLPGGLFLFDVPDLFVWSEYLFRALRNEPTPFPLCHILRTFYGWQTYPGNAHLSGWTHEMIVNELQSAGFENIDEGTTMMEKHCPDRIWSQANAHLYVAAYKADACLA